MISYIRGKVEIKGNDYIVLESNNIGYKIYMSKTALSELVQGDERVVYTYLRVLEDDLSLFGFLTLEELNMFELMLSVSGIGAKTALSMLSTMTPLEFALAVINDDVTKITKIPGIGPKGAKRVILELKDKVNASQEGETENIVKTSNELEEAISALQVLGFIKKDIIKVFENVEVDGKTSQELIKIGLKNLR